MTLSPFDVVAFVAFVGSVIALSMIKSRKEESSEDFFLAGRGLTWYLIGFSIVAANISTEQFVGMSGQGAGSVGLAVSGFQLLGSVTIVFVAIFFLPRFLRAGVYTIPEYLEYRYNAAARGIMAFITLVIYVTVTSTAVLYSGALTFHVLFDVDLTVAVWFIGFVAALYIRDFLTWYQRRRSALSTQSNEPQNPKSKLKPEIPTSTKIDEAMGSKEETNENATPKPEYVTISETFRRWK